MRCFILTLLAVTIVTANEENDKQVCMPKSRFKMDCNDCFCSNDGKQMGCTLKLCITLPETSGVRIRRAPSEFQVCKPGEVRLDNCQPCTCAPDGSRFYCGGPIPCYGRKRRESTICQPGDTKMKDCNSCSCVAIGGNEPTWHCTEMGCPEKERETREIHQQLCQPGGITMQNCNNCFCSNHSSGWNCTMTACLPIVIPPVKPCKRFCRTCECGAAGRPESCNCIDIDCDKVILTKDDNAKKTLLYAEPL